MYTIYTVQDASAHKIAHNDTLRRTLKPIGFSVLISLDILIIHFYNYITPRSNCTCNKQYVQCTLYILRANRINLFLGKVPELFIIVCNALCRINRVFSILFLRYLRYIYNNCAIWHIAIVMDVKIVSLLNDNSN